MERNHNKVIGALLRAVIEAGATISTAGKEHVRYPDHKRILFNGEDVTFKEMCDRTLVILNESVQLAKKHGYEAPK